MKCDICGGPHTTMTHIDRHQADKRLAQLCSKPGCGAQRIVGHPCADWDCPQRTVAAHDYTTLRARAEAAETALATAQSERDQAEALKAQLAEAQRDRHPWYGPCDGFALDGSCSECQRLKERKESGDDMVERILAETAALRQRVAELESALGHVKGCFDAAFFEGLQALLNEGGPLAELILRRLCYDLPARLDAALAATAPDAQPLIATHLHQGLKP